MRYALSAVVFVLSTLPAFAQQTMTPPTTAPRNGAAQVDANAKPMSVGTGIIYGRVIETMGGSVGGARVTLTFSGARSVVSITDGQGRFTFANLPPGRFSVTATADGYLDGAAGRMRPGGPFPWIDLADTERRAVDISLWRTAAISGIVLNDANEPIAGAPVQALAREVVAGAKRLSPGPRGTTDERGAYRIANLTPGAYVVALPITQTPAVTTGAVASGRPTVKPPAESQAYETMYYVAATTASTALTIPLSSGEERPGVDFILRPVPAVRVAGTLVLTDGPAAGVRVNLAPAASTDLNSPIDTAVVTTDARGAFTFDRITPGEYTLRALKITTGADLTGGGAGLSTVERLMPRADAPMLWAERPVSVGDRNVTDLAVTLLPAPRVSGRIAFEGGGEPPADLTTLEVFLAPADGRIASVPSRGPVSADGRFSTAPLVPGTYMLRTAGLIPGWTVKSAMYGGRDISDMPLDLRDSDADGVVITYTNHPTRLSGFVTSAAGGADTRAAVIVFPADPDLWTGRGPNPRRFYRLRTTQTGGYAAANLPPGAYLVAAVPDEDAADWSDPGFLSALTRFAAHVTISERDAKTQNLTTGKIR